LIEFSFEKFRSIKEKITIPIYSITVFIGENGGGKTAALQALELFFSNNLEFKNEDLNYDFRNLKDLDIIFSAKFKLTNKIEKEFFNKINPEIKDEVIIYKKFELDKKHHKYYVITMGTGTNLDEIEILGRKRKPYIDLCKEHNIPTNGKDTIDDMKRKLIEKRNTLPMNKKIEKEIHYKSLEEFFPKYILFRSEEAFEPDRKITEILKISLKEKIHHLNLEDSVNKIKSSIESVFDEKINEIKKLIQKYCPDITDIKSIPDFDILGGFRIASFQLIKNNKRINYEVEATGTKKQIMLGIYEWSNIEISKKLEKDFIIAFDEPDIHFDYHKITYLLNILKEFAKNDNMTVIIATHSLKLIDNFPPNQIIHFKLDKNKNTVVENLQNPEYEKIKEFLEEISLTLGLKNAFLFFEKLFVVVEGETELLSLPILFEKARNKTSIEAGITFINAKNNIRAIEFAEYLKSTGKKVIILIDKDSSGNKKITEDKIRSKGFIKDRDYFLIGKHREFEDEFEIDLWINMLNQKYKRMDGKDWTRADLRCNFNRVKFSDFLLEKVQTESINTEDISKPKLAYYLAKSIDNKNKIPKNLRAIFEKLDSLSS